MAELKQLCDSVGELTTGAKPELITRLVDMAAAGRQAVAKEVAAAARRACEKAQKEAADADQKSEQSEEKAKQSAQEAQEAADAVTSTQSKAAKIAQEIKELQAKLEKAQSAHDKAARALPKKKEAQEKAERNATTAKKEAQEKKGLLMCARAAAAEAEKAADAATAVVPHSGVQAVQPAAVMPVVTPQKMRNAVRSWLPSLSLQELQGIQHAMLGRRTGTKSEIASAIRSVTEARALARGLNGAAANLKDRSWQALHWKIWLSSATGTKLVP